MGKENIQVFARIRPLLAAERDYPSWIRIRDKVIAGNDNCDRVVSYRFDQLLDEDASQFEVYSHCHPLIESTFQGFNCTIFAYGQTGTGKTHTMLGVDMWNFIKDPTVQPISPSEMRETSLFQQRDLWGIIPQVLNAIFQYSASSSRKTRISCSYLEIYNENLFDLLNFTEREEKIDISHILQIRENRDGTVYVPDAVEKEVSSLEEALCLLLTGAQNRSVRTTDMNMYSSRSHTIFQITLDQLENDVHRIVSKINLVDLAGSEKWHPYQLNGFDETRIQELTSINKSLSCLGNCIRALSEARRLHIPYRDSKLTRLLQDALGGTSRTLFIITLSPSILYMDEGITTLQFAERAMQVRVFSTLFIIQIVSTIHEHYGDSTNYQLYLDEISRLKEMIGTQNNSAIIEENLRLREENEKLKQQVELERHYKELLLLSYHGVNPEDVVDKNIDIILDFYSTHMYDYLDSLPTITEMERIRDNKDTNDLERRVLEAEWAVACMRAELNNVLFGKYAVDTEELESVSKEALQQEQEQFCNDVLSGNVPDNQNVVDIVRRTPGSLNRTAASVNIQSNTASPAVSVHAIKPSVSNTERYSTPSKSQMRSQPPPHLFSSSPSAPKQTLSSIPFSPDRPSRPPAADPFTQKRQPLVGDRVSARPTPVRASSFSQSVPPITPLTSSPSESDLWESAVDPATGKTYYFHIQTLETSWKKPGSR